MNVAVRGERRCGWCGASLPARGRWRWCSKQHRQTAWRLRKLGVVAAGSDDVSRRLAYADPPYPGLSKKYYGDQASYAGEVDHAALVARLVTYDGWALSTSRHALRAVLALPGLPAGVLVCPWVKTHHQPDAYGPGNIHEYLLVSPGRYRRPGPPDALVAARAQGGDSDLVGRKPLKFVRWMFDLLGAQPGDTLDDLFPGSGVVGRCWAEFSRPAAASDVAGPRATGVAPGHETLDLGVAGTR